tara:strand:- start:734 stop:949 length:216 start_codon:yes stop_codon:yes gene_type:complete
MIFEIAIVILFLANVAVLGRALYTLLLDQGRGSKRTANLLLLRVGLAIALIATIMFGVVTGQLGVSTPWSP